MEPDRGCGFAPPGLEVGLDVSTLRQLLLEQSDKIRESGDRVLGAGMTKLRQKQEEYFNLIEAKVQRLSDRCNSLASRLQMLEEGQQFTETKDDALDNPEKIHWWSRTSGGKGRGAEDVAKGP